MTVLRVVPLDDRGAPPPLEQLQRWVESDLVPLNPEPPMAYALVYGLPGIEIARFAEHEHADLLVLGRKPRSRIARLLLGDTADAVARRSRVPCLFVTSSVSPTRLLVAIEGSERSTAVLRVSDAIARQIAADLRVLTVEPVYAEEPADLAVALPLARSARIQSLVRETLGHEIEVRRGKPTEQILAAVTEREADILVVGCHRGGPAGVIEAGSIARHLIHTAPCAVLTVPL